MFLSKYNLNYCSIGADNRNEYSLKNLEQKSKKDFLMFASPSPISPVQPSKKDDDLKIETNFNDNGELNTGSKSKDMFSQMQANKTNAKKVKKAPKINEKQKKKLE